MTQNSFPHALLHEIEQFAHDVVADGVVWLAGAACALCKHHGWNPMLWPAPIVFGLGILATLTVFYGIARRRKHAAVRAKEVANAGSRVQAKPEADWPKGCWNPSVAKLVVPFALAVIGFVTFTVFVTVHPPAFGKAEMNVDEVPL